MTTQTLTRPVTTPQPAMTALASALYTIVGEVLDAAVAEHDRMPGPDTKLAMEAAALCYETLAEEYEL